MPLTAGTRLGPYEIQSPLGAGGMGEVYRARDTRLERTVAIKILPEALAADPQFRERFDREARTISQLDHPHICTLHDVGEHQSTRYLVMQYLEGETLAARLERGALPLAEALTIAIQVAGALDAAHRAAIVHRDLKPGNVMLTKSGAKLLDFGLAKASAPAVAAAGLTMAPTVGTPVTAQGMILGTFQYMAPEQLEGKDADARTDIFAFGAVLYEMLTGRKAFEGKSHASLVAAILEREPAPVSTLQPLVPTTLERVTRTCLAKDPDDRWQTAREISRELRWIAEAPPATRGARAMASAHTRDTRRLPVFWAAAVGALTLGVVGLGIVGIQHLTEPAPEPFRFVIDAPADAPFPPVPKFAVSPDGGRIVFHAGRTLWTRALDELVPRPVPGTEGVDFTSYPLWSPDGGSIAFFQAGELKRVPAAGGPAVTLARAAAVQSASWSHHNLIVFAPDVRSPLYQVPAAGGTARPATTLDAGRGEVAHRWPSFLPDGRRFLYTAYSAPRDNTPGQRVVKVGSLDSSETTTVLESVDMAMYAAGHLLFARRGTLLAQRFDPRTLQLPGEAIPIDGVSSNPPGYSSFSISATGVLAYARSEFARQRQLMWFDRGGKPLGTVDEPQDIAAFALSRDESRLVVSLGSENANLWVTDLPRSTTTRLTFDTGAHDAAPAWSPDGRWIAFGSVRPNRGLYRKPANGGAQEELLVSLGADSEITRVSWSRDGKLILYSTINPETLGDIWVIGADPPHTPIPLLQTPADEGGATFAPDSRWVAYASNETPARTEVYVQPYPPTGAKYQISRGGGIDPHWREDGRELYFLSPSGTVMAASVETTGGIRAGTPRPLFSADTFVPGRFVVTRDGQRFLLNVEAQSTERQALTVVVNWPSTLER